MNGSQRITSIKNRRWELNMKYKWPLNFIFSLKIDQSNSSLSRSPIDTRNWKVIFKFIWPLSVIFSLIMDISKSTDNIDINYGRPLNVKKKIYLIDRMANLNYRILGYSIFYRIKRLTCRIVVTPTPIRAQSKASKNRPAKLTTQNKNISARLKKNIEESTSKGGPVSGSLNLHWTCNRNKTKFNSQHEIVLFEFAVKFS